MLMLVSTYSDCMLRSEPIYVSADMFKEISESRPSIKTSEPIKASDGSEMDVRVGALFHSNAPVMVTYGATILTAALRKLPL